MIKITDTITVKDVLTKPEACIDYFNLVYVNDYDLTIKRVKKGDKFKYKKENILISDENILKRINQLVVPPMWKNVRISDLENGHLQAIGRDAKGRKQYKYHLNWNAIRNKTKFFKMVDFGKNLPKIRKQVDIDLKQKEWTLNKVLALIVKLLEETHIRIGNQQYAKRNKTYGLTTLRSRHITKDENKIRFEFVGKKGKEHKVTLKNKKLVKLVNQCQEIPGWNLFQYYDVDGVKRKVDSSLVNDYLHDICGELFTAKDFRTWSASFICFNKLLDFGIEEDETKNKKNVISAIDEAAKGLGNTRNVSRKYYIHPEIIDTYKSGTIKKYFDTTLQHKKEDKYFSASEKSMLSLFENYKPEMMLKNIEMS